mmetsp:Transcript_63598/g.169008  ORF Transcript_63598/g.169008 Transcript_63598/m.169008 type:complete len:286 (-) Transcript_63598:473-1330(-)
MEPVPVSVSAEGAALVLGQADGVRRDGEHELHARGCSNGVLPVPRPPRPKGGGLPRAALRRSPQRRPASGLWPGAGPARPGRQHPARVRRLHHGHRPARCRPRHRGGPCRGHRHDWRLRAERDHEPADTGPAHRGGRPVVPLGGPARPAGGVLPPGGERRRAGRGRAVDPGAAADAAAAAVPGLPAVGRGLARGRGRGPRRPEPRRLGRCGLPRGAPRGGPRVAGAPGPQGGQADRRRGPRQAGVRSACVGPPLAGRSARFCGDARPHERAQGPGVVPSCGAHGR